MKEKKPSLFDKVASVLITAFLVDFFAAVWVALLWNWLCPVLFGLPEITLWQALGLNILITLLTRRE